MIARCWNLVCIHRWARILCWVEESTFQLGMLTTREFFVGCFCVALRHESMRIHVYTSHPKPQLWVYAILYFDSKSAQSHLSTQGKLQLVYAKTAVQMHQASSAGDREYLLNLHGTCRRLENRMSQDSRVARHPHACITHEPCDRQPLKFESSAIMIPSLR